MSTRLWYNKISEEWLSALPLGNGRLGAMYFGLPSCDKIEINEESCWCGQPAEEKYSVEPGGLDKLRALLFAEDYEAAAKYAEENFLPSPHRVRSYEAFGTIYADFDDESEADGYYKYLDLSTAHAGAEYSRGVSSYKTQCFVSRDYDVLLYRVSCENNNEFGCRVGLTRGKDEILSAFDDKTLIMSGIITFEENHMQGPAGSGVSFASVLRLKTDGRCERADNSIKITGAQYLEIYCACETDYNINKFTFDRRIDPMAIAFEKCAKAFDTGYEAIFEKHKKTHNEFFSAVSFTLEGGADRASMPTDERLERFKSEPDDFDLITLYYNYGRYLLMKSSGENARLPVNLQGVWGSGFAMPWASDYHTNINLQMNYWPCDSANIDAFSPFSAFIKAISKYGRASAKNLYNARGWTIHHTTDIFGKCGVHDSVDCGFFPMAGPWLCINLWEHFEFTNDLNYLKEIYPVLKGSCEFLLALW